MSTVGDETERLVGLHKLAADCGDGLIPELLTMMADRRAQFEDDAILSALRRDAEDESHAALRQPRSATIIDFPRARQSAHVSRSE